ncbi:hypothetical protein V5O48_004130 [Marasmius crinis-equi]|uniref:Integrase catalytic domain-containing protein n=1 Tax=Marasmius crinis-equi TaxID=585013 RepID=A0ABR3FRG9_9AGAR
MSDEIVHNFSDVFQALGRDVTVTLQTHNQENIPVLTRQVLLFQQRLQQVDFGFAFEHYRRFNPDDLEVMTDGALQMLLSLDQMRNAISDPPDHPFPFAEPPPEEPRQGPGRPRTFIDPDILKLAVDMRRTKRLADLLGVHVRTLRRRALEQGLVQPGEPVYVEFETEEGLVMRVYRSSTGAVSDISDANLDSAVQSIIEAFPSFGRRLIQGHLKFMGIHIPRSRVQASYARVVGLPTQTFGVRRISRRIYTVPGPNSLWHHDGQHGLIRYKIVIHAFVDGYSRLVTGIQANNNNRAETVLDLFVEAVEAHGCPSRARGDHGTENLMVAEFMERVKGSDRGSYLFGKSIHNIRIERLWRDVTIGFGAKWKWIFQQLETYHGLDVNNLAHLWLLHHLFLVPINQEAKAWAEAWNHHRMSLPDRSSASPVEMFTFGMMENGVRGMNEIMSISDDHLVPDMSLATERDAYGVDWNDLEDAGLVAHHQAHNAADSDDASNPFSSHRPDHFSHVEVPNRPGYCLCGHRRLENHPEQQPPPALPEKGGIQGRCAGFYSPGGNLTFHTICARPNCSQAYFRHEPAKPNPPPAANIPRWEPPPSSSSSSSAQPCSAATTSAFAATPFLAQTRNISVPRDGRIVEYEAAQGINARQPPQQSSARGTAQILKDSNQRNRKNGNVRGARDGTYFEAQLNGSQGYFQDIVLCLLPHTDSTIMGNTDPFDGNTRKRPQFRVFPPVVQQSLDLFVSHKLACQTRIKASTLQHNVYPQILNAVTDYCTRHDYLPDGVPFSEFAARGSSPILLCRLGYYTPGKGIKVMGNHGISGTSWKFSEVQASTRTPHARLCINNMQVIFISFAFPVWGKLPRDGLHHKCFGYHFLLAQSRLVNQEGEAFCDVSRCPAADEDDDDDEMADDEEDERTVEAALTPTPQRLQSSRGRQPSRSPSPVRRLRRRGHQTPIPDISSSSDSYSSSSSHTLDMMAPQPSSNPQFRFPSVPLSGRSTPVENEAARSAIRRSPMRTETPLVNDTILAPTPPLPPATNPFLSAPNSNPVQALSPVLDTEMSSTLSSMPAATWGASDELDFSWRTEPKIFLAPFKLSTNPRTGVSIQAPTAEEAAGLFVQKLKEANGAAKTDIVQPNPRNPTLFAYNLPERANLLTGEKYFTLGRAVEDFARIPDREEQNNSPDVSRVLAQVPAVGDGPLRAVMQKTIECLVRDANFFKASRDGLVMYNFKEVDSLKRLIMAKVIGNVMALHLIWFGTTIPCVDPMLYVLAAQDYQYCKEIETLDEIHHDLSVDLQAWPQTLNERDVQNLRNPESMVRQLMLNYLPTVDVNELVNCDEEEEWDCYTDTMFANALFRCSTPGCLVKKDGGRTPELDALQSGFSLPLTGVQDDKSLRDAFSPQNTAPLLRKMKGRYLDSTEQLFSHLKFSSADPVHAAILQDMLQKYLGGKGHPECLAGDDLIANHSVENSELYRAEQFLESALGTKTLPAGDDWKIFIHLSPPEHPVKEATEDQQAFDERKNRWDLALANHLPPIHFKQCAETVIFYNTVRLFRIPNSSLREFGLFRPTSRQTLKS